MGYGNWAGKGFGGGKGGKAWGKGTGGGGGGTGAPKGKGKGNGKGKAVPGYMDAWGTFHPDVPAGDVAPPGGQAHPPAHRQVFVTPNAGAQVHGASAVTAPPAPVAQELDAGPFAGMVAGPSSRRSARGHSAPSHGGRQCRVRGHSAVASYGTGTRRRSVSAARLTKGVAGVWEPYMEPADRQMLHSAVGQLRYGTGGRGNLPNGFQKFSTITAFQGRRWLSDGVESLLRSMEKQYIITVGDADRTDPEDTPLWAGVWTKNSTPGYDPAALHVELSPDDVQCPEAGWIQVTIDDIKLLAKGVGVLSDAAKALAVEKGLMTKPDGVPMAGLVCQHMMLICGSLERMTAGYSEYLLRQGVYLLKINLRDLILAGAAAYIVPMGLPFLVVEVHGAVNAPGHALDRQMWIPHRFVGALYSCKSRRMLVVDTSRPEEEWYGVDNRFHPVHQAVTRVAPLRVTTNESVSIKWRDYVLDLAWERAKEGTLFCGNMKLANTPEVKAAFLGRIADERKRTGNGPTLINTDGLSASGPVAGMFGGGDYPPETTVIQAAVTEIENEKVFICFLDREYERSMLEGKAEARGGIRPSERTGPPAYDSEAPHAAVTSDPALKAIEERLKASLDAALGKPKAENSEW